MRIAYLLNTLATGGAERLIVGLADRMVARGHAVEIVALREPAADELPSSATVRHLGIRRNPASLPGAFFRAIRSLRAFRPDIIHSSNFHGNILARASRPMVPGTRVVSTIHNVYEGGAVRSFMMRCTDGLSDHTAAVSHAAAEQAILRRVVPQSKCSVIANGVDCNEFSPQAQRRAIERGNAGLGNEFVWLAVGRLVPAKDYPNLLQAFAQVHAASPETRLWIAGEGKREYSVELRELAATLGLDASVSWLGVRRDIPALLDGADAFVLSSAWEGMPLALAEAMAMEKPFVATDVGGVRELAGECGEIVPARNYHELAAAMMKLMRESPELRQSRGQAARRRILEHFTIEQSAAQWEALYRRVIASRRRNMGAA
jgi:glycosyltransferase involved in cell wall biosynthesis